MRSSRVAKELGGRRRSWDRRGGGETAVLEHPLTYVANARDLADAASLGGVFGVPDFLWVDGDGNTPTIGPALTATGDPSSGQPTPWQLLDESAVTAEEYDGSARRQAAGALDPADSDDLVVAAMIRHDATDTDVILSGFDGIGDGVEIHIAGGSPVIRYGADGSSVDAVGTVPIRGRWAFVVGVVDRDDTVRCYVNGTQNGTTPATPAGAVTGAALTLGARAGGAAAFDGAVAWAALWQAPGIATTWLASSASYVVALMNRYTGVYPTIGTRGAFLRASAASWQDRNGRWHLASTGLPRAGDSNGFRGAPVRTNLCRANVDPQATTGWAVTDGTLTVVDDTAALAAAKCETWGPHVIQVANASGSSQYLYGGAVAAASAHSLSCLARLTAGSGVKIGWRDSSSGAWTEAGDVNDGYATRTVAHDATPPDTDAQWAIRVPDGCTIRIIAMQCEAGSRCTTPIPNWATAASAGRSAEIFAVSHTPINARGSIAATITPMGWAGSEGGTGQIIDRASAGYLIYSSGSGPHPRFYDSTEVLSGVASFADGVALPVRIRWAGVSRSIHDPSGRAVGAYSGALRSSGVVRVYLTTKESAVKNLEAYDAGS